MDGSASTKFVMFCRGPKAGEVWQDPTEEPFIYRVAYRPKHGRTRHVYSLTELCDDFYYYEYDGVQVRDTKMRWSYVATE